MIKQHMKRILNKETPKFEGQEVRVCGWVNKRRDHGKIVFIDLRDRTGLLQVVCPPELIKDAKEEFALEIEGLVKKRPQNTVNKEVPTGEIELQAQKINVLAKAASIPFDFMEKGLNLNLPTLLDWRPLTVRNPEVKNIFKVSEKIVETFRKTLQNMDFAEFQSPNIVPAVAEGGADVFHVDYYKYDAYLAQSPQIYKQIMLGAFERVFTVTRVFRAEPSVTTRHLSEFTSLDAEMAFIDSWQDLMDTCETLIRNMFVELAKAGVKAPELGKEIPRLKLREAQKIVMGRAKRDNRQEPDLSPEDEQEICLWAKEKYGSELVFITHYPVSKRPFYTMADPKDPAYTLSFDVLCRGIEIVTGGQRINDYDKLVKNIKKWGNDPKIFAFYLQAFKYGLPPEGGFAFGLERIVKQVLGLKNVRESTPFPRDMERVDTPLKKKK